ncbi:HNH protein [Halovirus HCTV-5]|uniref:HNH endonuclease n=1 Tax=Halovirus HCTV-5 TaxID=1273748 RepID=UPI000334835B|nr:HNH endonuclease [Halovirus HCTV-5]AGM11712.1 HNH protein [Halovirus HCTV-5]
MSSSAKETTRCQNCGEQFSYYPSSTPGKYCSRSCSTDANSGENHYRYSQVSVRCTWCGKRLSRRKSRVLKHDHQFCDETCEGQWRSELQSGDGNPNWRGGSDDEYPFGSNWEKQRAKALERDKVCQRCGEDGSDARLSVHHLEPRRSFDRDDLEEKANDLSNLVVLCMPCHGAVEHNPEVTLDVC